MGGRLQTIDGDITPIEDSEIGASLDFGIVKCDDGETRIFLSVVHHDGRRSTVIADAKDAGDIIEAIGFVTFQANSSAQRAAVMPLFPQRES